VIMIKKRFIAGVNCPKCNTFDSIVMFTTVDREWIECIQCDYTDNRPEFPTLSKTQTSDIGVVQFRPSKH